MYLVYTTQVNSTFPLRIAKYYLPPSSGRKTKWLLSVYFTNEVSLWSSSYSGCVVDTKTIIHLCSVSVKMVDNCYIFLMDFLFYGL